MPLIEFDTAALDGVRTGQRDLPISEPVVVGRLTEAAGVACTAFAAGLKRRLGNALDYPSHPAEALWREINAFDDQQFGATSRLLCGYSSDFRPAHCPVVPRSAYWHRDGHKEDYMYVLGSGTPEKNLEYETDHRKISTK